jgi:hypothetical protein
MFQKIYLTEDDSKISSSRNYLLTKLTTVQPVSKLEAPPLLGCFLRGGTVQTLM